MPGQLSESIKMQLDSSSTSSLFQCRTSTSIYAMICREIANRKFMPRDAADVLSRDPSYTCVDAAYWLQCGIRYRESKRRYERQFRREIRRLLAQQPNAHEAVFFYRILSITTLWPPMHNRREINSAKNNIFRTSQKARLNYLMDNDIT